MKTQCAVSVRALRFVKLSRREVRGKEGRAKCDIKVAYSICLSCTELCKIIHAKLREFLQIFPKMADWQEEAGLSSFAGLRRENSNMQESFYTTYVVVTCKSKPVVLVVLFALV